MTEFLSLKDRAAVVTGGAQGIGRAIVELLAQHGANIMVADLIAEKAEETAKEIAAKTGRKIVAHAVNVADNASAKEMIDAAIEQLGKVDILVNNAGITRDNLIVRITEADWDAVLDINLKGAFNCSASRGPLHDETALWTHRESFIRLRRFRAGRTNQLFLVQSGPDRIHQSARQGSRLAQHHRQRGGSRLYRDTPDGQSSAGTQGYLDQVDADGTLRQAGRYRERRSLSRFGRSLLRHRCGIASGRRNGNVGL